MPTKTKKSSQKPSIRLQKLLCVECGATIEVTKDSECWHCGCKLVKDERWRHKYEH